MWINFSVSACISLERGICVTTWNNFNNIPVIHFFFKQSAIFL